MNYHYKVVFKLLRWCGPCKLLGPRIEAEVDKQSGKVLLAKVDIDDMPEIAMQYKVICFKLCRKI